MVTLTVPLGLYFAWLGMDWSALITDLLCFGYNCSFSVDEYFHWVFTRTRPPEILDEYMVDSAIRVCRA
jgi:hypothetical protein